MSDYRVSQKARILYNHLYFSDLPDAYKRAIISNDFYFSIIRHPHFSPQLIEWLSGFVRLAEVSAADYQKYVMSLLDAPERIWQYAFDRQISEGARNILLALWSLGGSRELVDFYEVWQELHNFKSKKYNCATSPKDYKFALDQLEGSFIKISDQRIGFFSPSIKDFVENTLREDRTQYLDIVSSAKKFEQIVRLWNLSCEKSSEELKPEILAASPEVGRALENLLMTPHLRWATDQNGKTFGTYIDASPNNRITRLLEWAEQTHSLHFFKLAERLFGKVKSAIQYHVGPLSYVLDVVRLLDRSEWIKRQDGGKLRQEALDVILNNLPSGRYHSWKKVLEYRKRTKKWSAADTAKLKSALARYRESGLHYEIEDCRSREALQHLSDGLSEIHRLYGLSFRDAFLAIEERMAELPSEADEMDEDEDQYDEIINIPNKLKSPEQNEEKQIRNMFSSLLDE